MSLVIIVVVEVVLRGIASLPLETLIHVSLLLNVILIAGVFQQAAWLSSQLEN